MKGKKLLWSLVIVISLLLCGGGTGYAAVSGVCSNCHTMHNSQGGVPMRTDGPEPLTTPLSALLLNDCMGCHTTTESDPFVDGYPYVQLTTGAGNDSNCLAGGFFPPTPEMGMGNNDDNHHGMGNINDPAGKQTGSFYQGANGLSCAGINGCHGNETDLDDMAAISGGHHNPSAYRILYVDGDPVISYGAADYEELIIRTPTTAPITTVGNTQNVNIYSAGTVGVGEATISELCGKCHGVFHGANGTPANGTTNATGEWIRHPSDEELPTDWTMGGVYEFDGNDAKNNPFGYENATYTGNPTQVTCLSCHRAHGTANNDLLRWAYTTQDAGTDTADYGCLGCHNAQR